MKIKIMTIVAVAIIFCFFVPSAMGESSQTKSKMFNLGKLKPIDSELKNLKK